MGESAGVTSEKKRADPKKPAVNLKHSYGPYIDIAFPVLCLPANHIVHENWREVTETLGGDTKRNAASF